MLFQSLPRLRLLGCTRCGSFQAARACSGAARSPHGSSSCSSGPNPFVRPASLPADARFATFLRNFISSTLPAILLSVWQAVVLPIYFYNCAQVRWTGLVKEAHGGP